MSLNLRGKLGQVDGRRGERIKAFIIHRKNLAAADTFNPTEYDLIVGWRVRAGQGLSMRHHDKAPRWLCIVGFRLGADGVRQSLDGRDLVEPMWRHAASMG